MKRWQDIGFSMRFVETNHKGRKPRTFHAADKFPMMTHGSVGTAAGLAYIYVGRSTRRQRLKVGMTSDLDQRAKALGIDMLHAWPVAIAGARLVETEVFQMIGHKQGDTEWVLPGVTIAAIVAAVPEAIARVRRRAWVDAELTEEQARQLRIQLAGVDPTAPVGPLRKPRFSIVSYRKVMGTFGHNRAGRF